MNDRPTAIGEHTITDQWECRDYSASFDCLSQFRQSYCE